MGYEIGKKSSFKPTSVLSLAGTFVSTKSSKTDVPTAKAFFHFKKPSNISKMIDNSGIIRPLDRNIESSCKNIVDIENFQIATTADAKQSAVPPKTEVIKDKFLPSERNKAVAGSQRQDSATDSQSTKNATSLTSNADEFIMETLAPISKHELFQNILQATTPGKKSQKSPSKTAKKKRQKTPKAELQTTTQKTPKKTPRKMSAGQSETPKVEIQLTTQKTPKKTPKKMTKKTTPKTPNEEPEETPKVELQITTQKTPKKSPKKMTKKTPKKTTPKTPKEELEETPKVELQTTTQKTPKKTPKKMAKKTPSKATPKTPEEELEKSPKEELQATTQKTPKKTPKKMAKKTPPKAKPKTPEEELEKSPKEELQATTQKTPKKAPQKPKQKSPKQELQTTTQKTPKKPPDRKAAEMAETPPPIITTIRPTTGPSTMKTRFVEVEMVTPVEETRRSTIGPLVSTKIPFSQPITFTTTRSPYMTLNEYELAEMKAQETEMRRAWRSLDLHLMKTVPTPMKFPKYLKDPPDLGFEWTRSFELRRKISQYKLRPRDPRPFVRKPELLKYVEPKSNRSHFLRRKHTLREIITSSYFNRHYDRFKKPPFRTVV